MKKKKIYAKKTDALEQDLIAVHIIIWSRASPTMQTRVKSVKTIRFKLMHMIAYGCYNNQGKNKMNL